MAGKQVPPKETAADAEPEKVEMVEFVDAQHFEVRTITPENWQSLGVEDGKLIHWYKGNKFRVPRSDFDFLTDAQFSQYVLSDPRFCLVTE